MSGEPERPATAPYLQSYVAPVCRFTERAQGAWIEQLHGTAFVLGNHGEFLTARHVLAQAEQDVGRNGGAIGVFPMQPVNGVARSLMAPILDFEFAPEPYDIAVFRTAYRSPTFLHLRNRSVEVWQDIATMGYPASTVNKTAREYQVQQRVHKGYIQRVVPAGRLHPGTHPDCFELNFAITGGLSGAPLFIHQGAGDVLIGVCIGSHQSRVVQYESTLIIEGDEETREQVSRVEEFGIAHDIRPLLDWQPRCLGGQRLSEISV